MGDSSDGAAAGAGARDDGGFAPLAAGALAATSVLPPWIRVISERLERVIRGGPATTATYEPLGDPPANSALSFSIVAALALIATLGLRLLIRIETCKYAAHEPHYPKPGFYAGLGPTRDTSTAIFPI